MTDEPPARTAVVERATFETRIDVALALDGTGRAQIDTGIGFYDHLLTALTKHARFDVELRCEGDLGVDDHHSVEDVALAYGQALDRALGERRGIRRFAHAYAPLDEALARAVVDLSGRPAPVIALGLARETIGQLACENITHAFVSLAMAGRMALHVDVLKGANDHHRAEAAVKATALALRRAVALDGGDDVPSTKGILL
jgi:imidazoleglycerol-phosphate dehydratase